MPTSPNWGQNFVLLESVRREKNNRQNLLFADPVDIICCLRPPELNRCFRQMESYRQKGYYLAGFLAYELGYLLEESLNGCYRKNNYPLLWFGVFSTPRILPRPIIREVDRKFYLPPPVFNVSRAEYEKDILIIKELIAGGDTYQINYTAKYQFDFFGDVFAFYNALKERQKVSYSALINYGGNCIVSLSPELFFRINKNQLITVKPMKGTAPANSGQWLASDEKNKSENVMIVDLLRNDIGRICEAGSVRVKRLFEIEEYETVQQMTSTVQGKLLPHVEILELIKSLFPCGSVTGAPKINSMKIIHALEKEPRGIYTGAIGYLAPDSAIFNVAIRTIDLHRTAKGKYQAQMGIGGGIVADSQPRAEYEECLLKGKFLTDCLPDFSLLETMLCMEGKIKYLSAHLRRLKASARYFHIPVNISAVQQTLKKYATEIKNDIRLRLLLAATGKITIECTACVMVESAKLKIAISQKQTDSHDIFLLHKTILRDLYDSEHNKYKAQGYFDVIFQNEKGEITEGAISNIFISQNGRYYTPPVSCGLLNGIQRQIEIKRLKAKEKILHLDDLKKADKIFLTNSVRGINEVHFDQ